MLDYSYTEIEEEDIRNVFESEEAFQYRTTDSEATYLYAECEEEPAMFMNHLKLTVYEVQRDILTNFLKNDFIQYAARWDKGEFRQEVVPSDIPIIQKDIDYIRSKLIS